MTPIVDRFLKYVSFDTQSQPGAACFPSTEKQKVLGAYLVEEMKGIGIADAEMDEFGYVTGTVPSNVDFDVPVFGFISHMDTSPDVSGANVRPRIVRYEGGDLPLESGAVLELSNFPFLERYRGQELIVTDGRTLLGADDKAGIAEIMAACEKIIGSDMPHGKICIGFTPDEEIGMGAEKKPPLQAAVQYAEQLAERLQGYRVAFVHGKLKPKEKDEVIYSTCRLCSLHQQTSFTAALKRKRQN